MKSTIRINEQIRSPKLRVIGSDGSQLGILTREDAFKIAASADLDLVEISPNTNPPVVKVIDWGKFQYQKMKEQQKNKRKAKISEIKQVRFGLKIGTNDRDIKIRKVKEFLQSGHKVKIVIMFKGRELAHQELGYVMLDKISTALEDSAVIEQKPMFTGRSLSIVVRRR